jgi:hypothetical protein
MIVDRHCARGPFERGVVILSLDTEQIWGYLDVLNERQFQCRYPDTIGVHEKLLACLRAAGVSATWFLVGGMTLPGSHRSAIRRAWLGCSRLTARIPDGSEITPLWYRRAFVERCAHGSPTAGDWASRRADPSYLDRSQERRATL